MSTQILTELPNIQKAGMDYQSVLQEIHRIVQDNPNWKDNWAEFYSSEAGSLLTELMAWLADNLTTRQDLLYNEMFIGTAQKDADKIKHLKHIGYLPQMPHASKLPIVIQFEKALSNSAYLTAPRSDNLSLRINDIMNVKSKDINGKEINWEVLKIKDGKPSYLDSLMLKGGQTEYKQDSEGNDLYALQGKTVYEEFTTETNDGSYFNLKNKNIASDSIQVYIKKTTARLIEVNSFVSKDALDKTLPIPYVLELNENQTYRIRFGNREVLAKERLLPAGTTISIFYRTCDGLKGNINPGFMNYTAKITGIDKTTNNAVIKNILPGFGGTNKESLDSAVLNGPLSLRTMDRAVTPEDYNIILDRNTNIFKAKTYTATNQPDGFRNYYGRYINPQESFSFIMFHKNYKGVPTSKYNYFPWLTSNLEPRLNEKYVFDNGNYNIPVNTSGTMFNVKIMEGSGGYRTFKNATVLDLGPDWNDALYNKEGIPNDFLRAKITTLPTEEKYFSKIPFSLFDKRNSQSIGLKDEFGNPSYYISMDDNARYLSKQVYDLSIPVNVINARYLNIILNGLLSISVDLWAGDQFDPKNMPKAAYLRWSNQPDVDPKAFKDDPTKDAAENRLGIVELINLALNNACGDGKEFSYLKDISKQYYGLHHINNVKELSIPRIASNDFVDVSIRIKDIDYIFRLTRYYAETNFKAAPWGSLKNLADYLNWSFLNGKTGVGGDSVIYKIIDGVKVPIEREDLNKYTVSCEERIIFDSDYDNDEDDNDNSSTRTLYDLVIANKDVEKESTLTTLEFIDKNGFRHRLENVIDVCDPDVYPEFDGKLYEGLGNIIKEEKCGRNDLHFPQPTQAADYTNLASFKLENKKNGRLKLASPTIGESSTICFQKLTGLPDFGSGILGIDYDSSGFSNKAYGVKKAYLMREDALSVTISENGNYYESGVKIRKGNIIFENSCIYNSGDFSELYSSFKVKENSSLTLGSRYENFYYTGDTSDELLKEDISGVLGQHMDYTVLDNGVKKYYLNEDKSNFDIRFTSKPQRTNSLFSIKQDLDVVKSDKVKLLTADILSFPNINVSNLILEIDNEPQMNIKLSDCKNGQDIIETIRNFIIIGGTDRLKENIYSVVRSSYENSNKIEFNGIKRNNGSIKFYYDKFTTGDRIKNLYKALLGTSTTNSKFYKLYYKDLFPEENIITEEDGSYYYCPSKEKPLIFKYREFVENKEHDLISRGADYYINVEKIPIGNQFRYSYSIVKTRDSTFPDKEFYVHFINDKSFNYDKNGKLKENDESVLQGYMYKYKISGTDMTFSQPYFNTYDIAATIKYNSNFTETEVVQSVRKAVDEVCDLEFADIAGSMSRAKIFKAIMNCDGVEDCKITYFGEDYDSGEGNVETLKANFYEILCLHEDEENKHGKIFTFEVNN